MPIRVSLHHQTTYDYDKSVSIFPQTIRLRPAAHCRTPIESYSLRVEPRAAFSELAAGPVRKLPGPARVSGAAAGIGVWRSCLCAELTVINPFDFFLDEYAEQWPFTYDAVADRGVASLPGQPDAGPADWPNWPPASRPLPAAQRGISDRSQSARAG